MNEKKRQLQLFISENCQAFSLYLNMILQKKEELATEGQGKAETLNETTTKERGQPYIEISYERISFIFYHLYFCC